MDILISEANEEIVENPQPDEAVETVVEEVIVQEELAEESEETIAEEPVNVCTIDGDDYVMSGGAQIIFEKDIVGKDTSDADETDGTSGTSGTGETADGSTDKPSPFTIRGLVKALPEVSLLYKDIEPQVLDLAKDFNEIDPKYFPKAIFGDISDQITDGQELSKLFISEYDDVSQQIRDSLDMMPILLGSEEPVTFLVIPQNEKEMRSSGGLLTAYGAMTVDKGEIVGDIITVDMWALENYLNWDLGITPGYNNIYGQLALMQDGCGAYPLRAQDAGIYSDNYISMDMFKDYYDIASQYNPSSYPPYDYIVTFNTYFISDLVRLVEPITMDDGNILCAKDTAKKIFYETSINPSDPGSRKSYIGKVGDVLQEKITDMSVNDMLSLVQIVMSNVIAKHVSFYSTDPTMQAYFDNMGMTGRVVNDFNGDYFQLSEAQNCALKANFYIYDVVNQTVIIDDSGNITKEIMVQWFNEKVHDPAEEQMLTSSPYFLYRAWIRFYSPPGSTYWSKSTTGMISTSIYYPQNYYDDVMQKATWDDIMWFDHRRLNSDYPIKTATYSLVNGSSNVANYSDENGYRLLIQKHPGKKAEAYNLAINHRGQQYTASFVLDRDKVVTYKDGAISVENYHSNMDPLFGFIDTVKAVEL